MSRHKSPYAVEFDPALEVTEQQAAAFEKLRQSPPLLDFAREAVRAAHASAPESFVYFVACGGFVKIGTTTDIEVRLRALKIGNPYPISLVASIRGGPSVEAAFHRRFATFHHEGEWFRLQGALREYLANTLI